MKNLSKFTNTDVRLEDLKGCRAYYLRNKINNKEKLTREEKDYITLNINILRTQFHIWDGGSTLEMLLKPMFTSISALGTKERQ